MASFSSSAELAIKKKVKNKIMKNELKNPKWSRDELILALDYYLDCKGRPQKEGIRELSNLLNRMASDFLKINHKFRNINGVGLKLMNFRRLDPTFTTRGKTGLKHGGKEDEEVWNFYIKSPNLLKKTAQAIKSAINSPDRERYLNVDDSDITVAKEGRLLTRVHVYRERNSQKIKKALIDKASKSKKGLVCEVCNFSFSLTYGDRGYRFMEAHHTKPLSELIEETLITSGDLALICANCHRMIHSSKPWLSIEELKKIIAEVKKIK